MDKMLNSWPVFTRRSSRGGIYDGREQDDRRSRSRVSRLSAALGADHRRLLEAAGGDRSRSRVRRVPRSRPALDLQGLRRANRCFGQGPPGHRHEAGRSFGRVGAQHPRLAHLHVRLREDRRGHGHGEPGVQVPRARLRAEAVGHEGALRDRCLPRCGLPADHPRSGARVAERAARLPPFRGVPLPREPHLHGAREAPRLLQRAGTSAARPAQARTAPWNGPRASSTTTTWS